METPSTRGQGQGAAQVFDTSGLAKQYGQFKMLEEEKKAAAQKDLEKKVAEVSGAADAVFKEKYFATRDDGYIRDLYGGIQNKYKDKWSKVADVTSPEYREYKLDVQNLLFEAKKSQETKEQLNKYMDKDFMDRLTPESINYLNSVYQTPGMLFEPTRLREINKFDLDKWFQTEVQSPFFNEVEDTQQKNIGYNDKGEYTVSGTTTTAPQNMIDDRITIAMNNISADPKKMEKLEELSGLQGEEALGWFYNNYKDRLKYNKSNLSYSGKSGGDGDEDVFNEENIEEVTIKKGGAGLKAFTAQGIKFPSTILPVEGVDAITYNTGKPRKGVEPFSTETIDLSTGKPVTASGTFPVEYGSPMVLWFDKNGALTKKGNGTPKVMVPGRVSGDKASDFNAPILQPIKVLKNLYPNANQIESSLLKRAGGSKKESARERMERLKNNK